MDQHETYRHMYSVDRMERNLGIGTVGEALFRCWWEEAGGATAGLALRQFGYNPEGIVVGQKKAEMLKREPRSPDFAVFETRAGAQGAPLAGISINTQKTLYSMSQAQTPHLCYACPRAAECHALATGGDASAFRGNLWFNEYNITNDYRHFVESFEAEIVLVTIVSTAPYTVWNKIRALPAPERERWEAALRSVVMAAPGARAADAEEEFRTYLLHSGGRPSGKRRSVDMVWQLHSELVSGGIPYHVTGAPVSVGRPRPVACVDYSLARPAGELLEWLDRHLQSGVRP